MSNAYIAAIADMKKCDDIEYQVLYYSQAILEFTKTSKRTKKADFRGFYKKKL